MSRLTRDGTAEPVSRDQIPRHARGQGNIIFLVQLTPSRIGNLTRFIHTLLYVMTTYIYTHIYDIYIYVRFIHWMCGVFRSLADTAHTRRHIPIGGSVAGKGGVTYIAAHSSPTRRRGVALPEMVLQLD